MPWANAWSGGAEVIASSVEVVNNRVVVASINDQGNISGQIISANSDILLAGQSLIDELQAIPSGINAYAQIQSAHLPTAAIGASEVGVLLLKQTISANRLYQVFLGNILAQVAAAPARVVCRVRYTTDGSTPTTSSPRLFETYGDAVPNSSGFVSVGSQQRFISATSQTQLNLLFSSQDQIAEGGAQSTHQFIGLETGTLGAVGPMLGVIDTGPFIPDTGNYVLTGGGTNPQFKTFDINCYDSQSYQGNGAASNGSGGSPQSYMYFGQDPGYAPNGNWRSYAWFNTSSTAGGNGLGSIADMSGVPAGSVQYLDVWFDTVWWYYIAGGTLYVGHSGAGVNHSSEPRSPGPAYQEKAQGFGGRGQSQWFSILGTGIASAILGGLGFQALVLGPGPTTDYGYYGYCPGAAGPGQCRIRGGYYK